MLRFEVVTHIYNFGSPYERKALEVVSFEIPKGGFLLVLGENGSGKTTLLMLASGLMKPTFGEIYAFNEKLENGGSKNLRKRIGILFQFPENQFFAETVEEEVKYAGKNFEIPSLEKRFDEVMQMVGLPAEKIANLSPFKLSGGEMRRVAFASVLIYSPELLILDEPTASLDYMGIIQIRKILSKIHENNGTVVVSTHWPEYFLDMASHVLVLKEGRKVFFGGVREFLLHSEKKLLEYGLTLDGELRLLKHFFEKHGRLPEKRSELTKFNGGER
ncbi:MULTISPECIES: energy-coupling factor ABC transporter ATP-binding protein [unclassified Kosmotoga]|uniref:energy-coupling factor ABC transporter ATP-binding protein n=1 Tax=unclassified Kosmotoga TaxID=2631489 RepID=UPI0007C5B000|nr:MULTISPECIES: ATP-binding cassette domain-containing protein [unclassified Kosmotoga]MDI3524396.1 energy-coupling factor transport system ATP-binding protein [Kosmotoga sp.]